LSIISGVDHQIDTYFNVCQNGRLKLRQGFFLLLLLLV